MKIELQSLGRKAESTMKRLPFIFLFALFAFGCAHPYIGRTVNTSGPAWCQLYSNKVGCTIHTQHIDFVFKVIQNEPTEDCLIEGLMEPTAIKSFSNFNMAKSNFFFVLAYRGVVTDMVSFMPQGYSNVRSSSPIKLEFKTKPFDAITVTYEFSVS